MAKQLGERCAAPTECDSTFCAEGFCCDRACTGGCERCDLSAKEGTCTISALDDKCDVACADAESFRPKTCDGVAAECVVADGGISSCGRGGCLVLPSGKGLCAECSDTVPCSAAAKICRDGVCLDASAPPPPPASCQTDADCAASGQVCAREACVDRSAPSAFASIEPLPLDESCGCRLPGAAGGVSSTAAGLLAIVCAGLVLLRRRRGRRVGALPLGVLLATLTTGALASTACSPQEDLPANQACLDMPIALSAAVLACTDDYEAARRVGNGFEGKYRCNATDVADTPRYYRCPADMRALPCADVEAAGEDYDQLLGRSNACRLLFSHPDGGAIPPIGAQPAAGGAAGAGAAGFAGSAP